MICRYLVSTFILLTLANFAPGQIASGGGFSLEKSVVAGGGQTSSGGAFTLGGTVGQEGAGTNTNGDDFAQIGGFWTPDALQPTAAVVSLSGKVTTADGRGIRNALVTLTDMQGVVRSITTGSFGGFHFDSVEVGQSYVLTVSSRRFSFGNGSRIIEVNEDVTGLDFIAVEQ